jgi:hypothetical protein
VEYTLTHSRYQFTAVTLADGFDGGYMNYLLWPTVDYVRVNGGPPIGSSLPSWLKNSPGFNLDKVSAAVRLEYYGPAMFLGGGSGFPVCRSFKSLSILCGFPMELTCL